MAFTKRRTSTESKGENLYMSTLAAVERVLRETKKPMSVRDIVEYAGDELPTRSKTPDTVVARDLSMDIKRKGEESLFARTAPGRYTMREFVLTQPEEQSQQHSHESSPQSIVEASLRNGARAPLKSSESKELIQQERFLNS